MTTTFILAPGEEMIQCPYNLSHQVTNARLLTHLDKCRSAFKKGLSAEALKKNMRICRHNALHHYPAPEIRFHEDRCPDAMAIVRHLAFHNSDEGNKKYEEIRKQKQEQPFKHPPPSTSSSWSNRKAKTETKPVIVNPNDYGLQEEDWESESSGYSAGYNPEVKLKSEVILYVPSGLTKSERKKFRAEVREKAMEKELSGEPVELPTAQTFDVSSTMTDLKIKEERKHISKQQADKVDNKEVVDLQDDSNSSSGASGHSDKRRRRSSSDERSSKRFSPSHYSSSSSSSKSNRNSPPNSGAIDKTHSSSRSKHDKHSSRTSSGRSDNHRRSSSRDRSSRSRYSPSSTKSSSSYSRSPRTERDHHRSKTSRENYYHGHRHSDKNSYYRRSNSPRQSSRSYPNDYNSSRSYRPTEQNVDWNQLRRPRERAEDDYTDSDDFEGVDPYDL